MTILGVFGPESPTAAAHAQALCDAGFASRLFNGDSTLWGDEAAPEASIRLGWTEFAERARSVIAEAAALRSELSAAGVDRVVLCGMGGSSLAPMVIAPSLTVLDTTHPDAVRDVLEGDLTRTVVVVSSKSGSTVETLSHRAAFAAAFTAAGIDAHSRIVVVTDPGSSLEASARAAGQRVFLADPHVGGRFSALTAFGIVPSVLSGADVASIVDAADAARQLLRRDDIANPALQLAAMLAAGLPEQFVLEVTGDDTAPAGLGLWIEQLIAESTGKRGIGVLPIALEASKDVLAAPPPIARRIVLSASAEAAVDGALTVSGSLGSQFLLWEVATAALGHLMGIDPFNQPDVEAAKVAARELLDTAVELDPTPVPSYDELLSALREALPERSYLAIQAFANPRRTGASSALERLRARLAADLEAPVSAGWGPRYLHSTGQLHKGGPASCAFLQLVELGRADLAIPGESATFGELIAAQSSGDASVLRSRNRSVVTYVTHDLLGLIDELGI